jgi:hypothetical protein
MEERLRTMLGDSSRTDRETARLARLMWLIGKLPHPPDPASHFKSYDELKRRFLAAAGGDDGELVEERFLELYAHLHMHEAPYTPAVATGATPGASRRSSRPATGSVRAR